MEGLDLDLDLDLAELSQDYSSGPITALEVSLDKIIAGSGNQLLVYNLENSQLEAKREVLRGATIHGIRKGFKTETDREILCIYGAKETCIVVLKRHGNIGCEVRILIPVFGVNDWIWEAHWLKNGAKRENIALALAHNSVVLWDWKNSQLSSIRNCDEKCILYCAHFIGESWDTLILAAGTVFNQVVLWPVGDVDGQYANKEDVPVMHTLSGHKGVIFSIKYHAKHKKLCSASDDRSIQIWQLSFPCESIVTPDVEDWKSMESVLILTLFGHTARVWDAVLLNECFASVGEDATCYVWNYSGKIISKFKGHKGRSIWSITANKDETVILTGGGDSSIRMWEIKADSSWSLSHHIIDIPENFTLIESDFPRVVTLISFDIVLIMMNSGCFSSHCLSDGTWNSLFNDERFVSYSIISPCPDKHKVAIGGITGVIKVLMIDDKLNGSVPQVEQILFDGKVLSIIWISEEMLLVSGPGGHCQILTVTLEQDTFGDCSSLKIFSNLSLFLPSSKHRWITAASSVQSGSKQLLICGDKDGSIHSYVYSQNDLESMAGEGFLLQPIQKYYRVHGKSGVTSLYFKDDILLYSTGRDGYYRQWELKDEQLILCHSVKVTKGFEWIDRIEWCDSDMLIYGFFSAFFVVWNVSCNQQIVSVHCGGGHRSWGCCHEEDALRFVYLKTGKIYVVDSKQSGKQSIIKPPLHGRELCDVKFIKQIAIQEDCPSFLVCTASEDTVINVGLLQGKKELITWKPQLNLKGHLSSVRCFAISHNFEEGILSQHLKFDQAEGAMKVSQNNLVSDDYILFTGGGRAEIRAWKLCISDKMNQETISKASKTSVGVCVNEFDAKLNLEDTGLIDSTTCNNAISLNKTGTLVSCTYEELSSHFLGESRHKNRYSNWKARKLCLDPETRVMSLSATPFTIIAHHLKLYVHVEDDETYASLQDWHIVSAAGSDGILRVFFYNSSTRKLHSVVQSSIHKGCVLKVMHFLDFSNDSNPILFLFSTSTNGCIIMWCLEDIAQNILKLVYKIMPIITPEKQMRKGHQELEKTLMLSNTERPFSLADSAKEFENDEDEDFRLLKEKVEPEIEQWQPVCQLKIHQSGVNSISACYYKDDIILVASGGDDNTLAVQMIEVIDSKVTVLAKTVEADAHAAQITGIWLVSPSVVVSASIDQRVCVWTLHIDGMDMKLTVLKCKFIHIADISSMDVLLHRQTLYLLFGGEGLCLYSFK